MYSILSIYISFTFVEKKQNFCFYLSIVNKNRQQNLLILTIDR